MHARSGGNLEVMGLLLGKVDANVMVVMDSFALPVEGTETRVNAQAQGYEYMTAYIEAAKQVNRDIYVAPRAKIKELLFPDQPFFTLDFNSLGWTTRKCHRLVPFTSWIWLLVIRN